MQRIQLRTNQSAKFGSSGWADYSFQDEAMSDMHFEVRCSTDGCHVVNLSKDRETLVNGESIVNTQVHHGDEILAGETSFAVEIEGVVNAPPPVEEAPPPEPAVTAVQEVAQFAALAATCAYLELPDEIQTQAEATPDPNQLIAELAEQEHFMDAMRLRAYLLPKRDAVWWGCLCVRDDLDDPLDPPQVEGLEAAVSWVAEQDEEHRRFAESKAEAAKMSGPGGMLALSAFWSDGSIGASDGPAVPPDRRLTCQGVAGALITAAYHGDASKANDRMVAFLAKGQDVADGKFPCPKPS